MKYGDNDQPDEVEAARKRSQRWVQLCIMPKRELVALYARMMHELDARSLFGGPVTAHDYADAIGSMERQDEADKAHLAAAGPGHERCPSINYVHTCGWEAPQ